MSSIPRESPAGKSALVIGHPGHELRVHSWIEGARPLTFVLTDGSGHAEQPRLASTTSVLEPTGAERGSIYGAMSDRKLYRAILDADHATFARLAERLAAAILEAEVTMVVGDAAEGFNPGHDVCRLLLNAAVLLAERRGGRRIANMEFPVEGSPDKCPAEDRADAIILELDEAAYARKMAAAGAYPELAGELERLLRIHGADAFRTECLRPVRYGLDIAGQFAHPCFYEQYGRQKVAAGIYREVIRFRDVARVAQGLAALTGRDAMVAGAPSP